YSWLLMRGIKTLGVRMRVHHENAMAVYNYLTNNDKVVKVYYPGNPDSTGYEIAKKQMNGFGAMISFELQPGLDAKKFVESLKLIDLAESLGGDRKSTRLNSSHVSISYAVFCLKKKKTHK